MEQEYILYAIIGLASCAFLLIMSSVLGALVYNYYNSSSTSTPSTTNNGTTGTISTTPTTPVALPPHAISVNPDGFVTACATHFVPAGKACQGIPYPSPDGTCVAGFNVIGIAPNVICQPVS